MFRSAAIRLLPRSRSYVTSSSAVPLTLHGIDGRYATALFTAAQKSNSLDKIEGELAQIKQLMDKDEKFKFFLQTPIISKDDKKAGIAEILKKGGFSATSINFFELLADNGRLDQTEKVAESFQQLVQASRGQVPVTVTSAKDLDNKTVQKIKDTLQKSNLITGDQKIVLSTKVNPAILGGLIIEVGDKTMDLSVSAKISKLNRLLQESI